LCHSTLGSRVINKKKEEDQTGRERELDLEAVDAERDNERLAAVSLSQSENKYFKEMCSGSEAGSHLRRITLRPSTPSETTSASQPWLLGKGCSH